jgi:hypothetical protein
MELQTRVSKVCAKPDGLIPRKCDTKFYVGLREIELLLVLALTFINC